MGKSTITVEVTEEELIYLRKLRVENAKNEVYELRRRLRTYASTNAFALECWLYYHDHYDFFDERKIPFHCSYLKDCLRGIEEEGYC